MPVGKRQDTGIFSRLARIAALGVLAAGLTLTGALPGLDSAQAAPRKAVSRKVAHKPARRTRQVYAMPAGATDPVKDAALVVDADSGRILYARNAAEPRHPASLTKMMTLYLLFDALKKGQVSMNTPLPVSRHAASQKPTKLNVAAGSTIPVETAIKAIVVLSANDVAVTIAEALGGTEAHFAELMTQRARQIGMRQTYFHNASGLPDPLQITTASDMALLGRRLAYDFPQFFPHFATMSFSWAGRTIKTHDNLLGRYAGADGIKTGYTGASGFNLVSSVMRGGVRIIGVVMGGRTAPRRDAEMMRILDNTFVQLAANPSLIGRSSVPWSAVAQATPAPVVAGFDYSAVRTASAAPMRGAQNGVEDEDAAESQPDDELGKLMTATSLPAVPAIQSAPTPAPSLTQPRMVVAALPPPFKPAVATTPVFAQPAPVKPAQGATGVSRNAPMIIAAYPQPKPVQKPEPKAAPEKNQPEKNPKGNNYTVTSGALAGAAWTIQIGAFADPAQAKAQLASYAQKSRDVLGAASRIVQPFQAVGGSTLYRARFGPFQEREARNMCARLTQRGQTCFATQSVVR